MLTFSYFNVFIFFGRQTNDVNGGNLQVLRSCQRDQEKTEFERTAESPDDFCAFVLHGAYREFGERLGHRRPAGPGGNRLGRGERDVRGP